MRLKKASLALAGVAAAVGITMAAAGPAWACAAPTIKNSETCNDQGGVNWTLTNGNTNRVDQISYSWSDDKNEHGSDLLDAGKTVTWTTHDATMVHVTAKWNGGDHRTLLDKTLKAPDCGKKSPSPTPTKTTKPKPKPTKTVTPSPTPSSTTPASNGGDAGPATPVTGQPHFTG